MGSLDGELRPEAREEERKGTPDPPMRRTDCREPVISSAGPLTGSEDDLTAPASFGDAPTTLK